MIRSVVGLLIVGLVIAGVSPLDLLGAEGAVISFRTGALDGDWNTIFGPDGKPVPDSSYMMLILAGEDGVVDPPNCDGSPGGDDLQPTGNVYDHLYVRDPASEIPVTPSGNIYHSGRLLNADPPGNLEEPAVNTGDTIYWRAFNNKEFSKATHYNDMIAVDGKPMTAYEIPAIQGLALYTVILTFGPAQEICP